MIPEYLQVHELVIIAVGKFNPAIIQPYWLANKKFIREPEAEEAKIVVVHNEFSSFDIEIATIEVTLERFLIKTRKEHNFHPLADLAFNIFQTLSETPISAFGINHLMQFSIPSDEVYFEIGNKLAPLSNLRDVLTNPKVTEVDFVQQKRTDERAGSSSIKIKGIDAKAMKNGLLIQVNDHFDLGANGTGAGMASQMKQVFENTYRNAIAIPQKIWNNLNS